MANTEEFREARPGAHGAVGAASVADAGFKERGGCSGGEITKRGRVREGDVPPPARSAEAFENVNSVC